MPDELPDRCPICMRRPDKAPPIVSLPVPLLSRNALYPAAVCSECNYKLFLMFNDLPWIRYQLSQYVVPAGRPGYGPDGSYIAQDYR